MMKRIWTWTILGLLVVVILAVIFNGPTLIGAYVGSRLEKALGVGVDVEKADWDMFRGQLHLSDVTVDNPPGFAGHIADIASADVDFQWGEVFGDANRYRRIDLHIRQVDWIRDGDNSNLKEFNRIVAGQEKQVKNPTRVDLLQFSADNLRYVKAGGNPRVIPVQVKNVSLSNLQGNTTISEEVLGTIVDHSGLVKPAVKGRPGSSFVRFGNRVVSTLHRGATHVGHFFKRLFGR